MRYAQRQLSCSQGICEHLRFCGTAAGESYFFLTDDPYNLQRAYLILANPDGSEPDEYDLETAGKAFRLADCPALSGADAAFSDLYLGRRWFSGRAAKGHESDAAFWDVLTKGANP